MIQFEAIQSTVKTALEAADALALVPVVVDLGYGDKAVELHLQNSGLCLAVQPIFGWAPLLQETDAEDGPLFATVDLSVRLWINPQHLETSEITIGSDVATQATGNVTLSDGSTVALYDLIITIIATVAQIVSGETARAFVPSGGILTSLDTGAMCYDLSWNVRAEMLY